MSQITQKKMSRTITSLADITAKDDDSPNVLLVPKGKSYPVLFVEDRKELNAWLVTIGYLKSNGQEDNWGDFIFPKDLVKFSYNDDKKLFSGNAQIILEYLRDSGYLSHQIAAILGSIQQESSFNPYAKEQGPPYQGIGLFQWSYDRKKGVPNFTGNVKTDIINQLKHFEHELKTTERRAGVILKNSIDLKGAMSGMKSYERYGIAGKRYIYANRIYQQLISNS